MEQCVHQHTSACYADAEEIEFDGDATPSDAELEEASECPHICDEESGCITKVLDCQHEHDRKCGYSEGVMGTPCGYVCDECQGNALKDDNLASDLDQEDCICTERCTADQVNVDCQPVRRIRTTAPPRRRVIVCLSRYLDGSGSTWRSF